MDLAEWRKRREGGEAFELPSGLVVDLRRVQLLDLAAQGRVPAPLLGLSNQMLAQDSMVLTVEAYAEYAPVMKIIVAACLAGPEGLEVDELGAADLLSIYNWANEVTVMVRPFRGERNGAALA